MSSRDSEDFTTLPELKDHPLPEQSRNKYNKIYVELLHWKNKKKAPFSENVLLSYFSK